ncbi:hypothetical protein [Escherichia coli]|uniref:hypothetical protein n=1 Tax=Escherichia coli TaxID=562 RepID=UPI003859F213
MQQFAIAGAASVRPFNPILSVQHSRKNILTGADFKQPRMKSLLGKVRISRSFLPKLTR